MWYKHQIMFPREPLRLVTKYAKEIEVGRDCMSLSSDDLFDVSPFYPLLTFP